MNRFLCFLNYSILCRLKIAILLNQQRLLRIIRQRRPRKARYYYFYVMFSNLMNSNRSNSKRLDQLDQWQRRCDRYLLLIMSFGFFLNCAPNFRACLMHHNDHRVKVFSLFLKTLYLRYWFAKQTTVENLGVFGRSAVKKRKERDDEK